MFRRIRAMVCGLATLGCSLLTGCMAHVGYDDDYYDDAPPPGYVATVEPYYYEGRPVYWWGGNWHYHDHGHWRHYRDEPEQLRGFRTEGRPMPSPGPRFGRPAPAPAGGEVGRPVPSLAAPPRAAPVPPVHRAGPRFYERSSPRR